jgi:hypothetical protein
MSNITGKTISQLTYLSQLTNDTLIPVELSGVTYHVTYSSLLNNFSNYSGNTDTLGGSSMRTIYSRSNVIEYLAGTESDLFSGSTNFGSRNFPQIFFTNSTNYNSKTIHFRVTGLWASGGGNDTTATITLKLGNDTLSTITETLPFSSNKPSEIYGEILITNGNAIVCYAVGWCDQTGDYRKTALSNPVTPINVTGFNGGDFKLLIESTTTRNFTSYLGYIQIWN